MKPKSKVNTRRQTGLVALAAAALSAPVAALPAAQSKSFEGNHYQDSASGRSGSAERWAQKGPTPPASASPPILRRLPEIKTQRPPIGEGRPNIRKQEAIGPPCAPAKPRKREAIGPPCTPIKTPKRKGVGPPCTPKKMRRRQAIGPSCRPQKLR